MPVIPKRITLIAAQITNALLVILLFLPAFSTQEYTGLIYWLLLLMVISNSIVIWNLQRNLTCHN
ncbi:hypothetical protein [Latilactobacillus fuchuensis]|uniref:Sakacin Q immunity protein n=2 Tax=Latilactobacillus fuchuensis TaxID=164393 RepID=A0A2N9DTV2_9LACO|nr:hypothetical protein [Latilactobacillus fuchuensis]KRL61026.1 hypothetical protein FC69_GL001041 [Latilactobacillus fuchuensis DSM 14340 = JCM 11249]SPC37045.1 Sakacin Q immunity protein [Latilactobacillus fuchuensis]